jgi:hypothetical protein
MFELTLGHMVNEQKNLKVRSNKSRSEGVARGKILGYSLHLVFQTPSCYPLIVVCEVSNTSDRYWFWKKVLVLHALVANNLDKPRLIASNSMP